MARGLMKRQEDDAATTTPPPRGAPPEPEARASDEGEESSNVTPEEQAQYDQFVANGMQLLYSPQALPRVLQAMQGDGDPVEGLANALVTLVTRLEDSAGKGNAEISGDVKFHGATELLGQMADLAKEAGIHDYSEDEQERALYLALDLYRNARQQQGQLPQEAINQDWQELVQADQQGTIEEVLPGVRELAGRAPTDQQAPRQERRRRGLARA